MWSKIKRIYRAQGFYAVLRRAVHKLRNWFFTFNSARWLVCDITDFLPSSSASDEQHFKVTFSSPGQAADWIQTLGEVWMLDPREFQVAENAGHIWCLITVDEENVGYLKIGRGTVFIPDFTRSVNFPPQQAFIYDTYILPEKRGLGLGRILLREALKHIHEREFRGVICHIPYWNKASYALFTSAGFFFRRRIWFLRFLGIPYLSFNPENLINGSSDDL